MNLDKQIQSLLCYHYTIRQNGLQKKAERKDYKGLMRISSPFSWRTADTFGIKGAKDILDQAVASLDGHAGQAQNAGGWGRRTMEPPGEMMQQVGAFEPSDARKVIASLEARSIPFEVETDDSALFTPNRWLRLSAGMYPEGSKVAVFVPESKAASAMEAISALFPV